MYFMFDWSIYRLFVLNRCWKLDSLQMMIFVNVCSNEAWLILKTRFETWITRNVVNGVSLFHLFIKNTYGLPVFTKDTKCPNQVFYVWLVDLHKFVPNKCWKLESLQIMIFVYVCPTCSLVDYRRVFRRE
jgi:hypothetical protein